MRRSAAALTGAGALLLAGCSAAPGDFYATDTDVARAHRAWADPWLAPDLLRVPEAGWGTDGQVNRTAALRTTTYAGSGAARAVAEEVRGAAAAGWDLVGVACTDVEVRAVLARGGTDLETALAAEVTADVADRPRDEPVDVSVAGVVPHHLDDDWADLGPALAPADTCLGGGTGAAGATMPDEEPRGAVDDDVDVPEWSDDDPAAADRARLDAVTSDLWYAAAAAGAVPELDGAAGDSRRRAPTTSGTVRGSVVSVVDDMPGWVLTFARCSRRSGTVATLRLAGDAGPVVARLTSDPARPREVAWTVRLPVVGGPDQGWVDDVPALVEPTCLTSTPLPRGPVAEGVPVGLLEELQAMR